MKLEKEGFKVALVAVLALTAVGAPVEWPVKKAELKSLSESGKTDLPKTLTMLFQSSERFRARPSALILGGDGGTSPARFEIIAQSDEAGSITYRAQKLTPRGVKVLQVQDHPNQSRASDQFEWEVTMINEDGISEKLGGNPRPADRLGLGLHEQ